MIQVKVNNKMVSIPKKEVERLQNKLHLTENEAIDLYLTDNDYKTNEIVQELTQKAKENKSIVHNAKSEKERKKRTVEPKKNPVKEEIIHNIFNYLKNSCGIDNILITNSSKLIEFSYQNKNFKLDLIEKREKKDKK